VGIAAVYGQTVGFCGNSVSYLLPLISRPSL